MLEAIKALNSLYGGYVLVSTMYYSLGVCELVRTQVVRARGHAEEITSAAS